MIYDIVILLLTMWRSHRIRSMGDCRIVDIMLRDGQYLTVDLSDSCILIYSLHRLDVLCVSGQPLRVVRKLHSYGQNRIWHEHCKCSRRLGEVPRSQNSLD